jgi:hypothetical protein
MFIIITIGRGTEGAKIKDFLVIFSFLTLSFGEVATN